MKRTTPTRAARRRRTHLRARAPVLTTPESCASSGPLYEIAGVWIKRPDEMGSGNALRNADSPLERLGSWHRVRTGSNPLERLKAEGAITWLMPGHGESGDYLRCSEHKRPSARTEDCGRTAAG